MNELVHVRLEGHLTEPALREALTNASAAAPQGRYAMVIDCLAMSGYEMAARHAFVEWHRRERARIARVAVITSKRLWHMVVSAMGVASGQVMKAFDTRAEAERWARGD